MKKNIFFHEKNSSRHENNSKSTFILIDRTYDGAV